MQYLPSLPDDLPTRKLTPADSNAIPLCNLTVWQAFDGEWYVDGTPPDPPQQDDTPKE